MIIFSKEDLGNLSAKQLESLRNYYRLPKVKKPKLIDLLFDKINPKDVIAISENPTNTETHPVIEIEGQLVPVSARMKMIYEQNKDK